MNTDRLKKFVSLLGEGLTASAAAHRLGYAWGPSSWANGSKMKRLAREAGWLDAQGKPIQTPPRPVTGPAPRLMLPPDELRAVRRIDAELSRRLRRAEFLAVPLADIPELQKGNFREWFLQDRLGPFRGSPPPWPDRPPRWLSYCDPEIREAWHKKRKARKGWNFIIPISIRGEN